MEQLRQWYHRAGADPVPEREAEFGKDIEEKEGE